MCWVSMGGMAVTDKPYQCSVCVCVCVCVCVRVCVCVCEHSYASKAQMGHHSLKTLVTVI